MSVGGTCGNAFCLLTLHEHEHPHIKADACGACRRDIVLHCIIVVVTGSSSPLPWWAQRACNERRMFGGIWAGAAIAIGGSIARARGREVGHSHSEAAVYIYLENIYDGM